MTALSRAQRRARRATRGFKQRASQRLQDATLRRLRWEIRTYRLGQVGEQLRLL